MGTFLPAIVVVQNITPVEKTVVFDILRAPTMKFMLEFHELLPFLPSVIEIIYCTEEWSVTLKLLLDI